MIPVLLGAAAIVGSWRIEDANNYAREINELNEKISTIVNASAKEVVNTYEAMEHSLTTLDETEKRLIHGNITQFIDTMSRIYDFEYRHNPTGVQKTHSVREQIRDNVTTLINIANAFNGHSQYAEGVSFAPLNAVSNAAKMLGLNAVSSVMAPAKLIYGYSKSNDARANLCATRELLAEAEIYRESCNGLISVMSAIKAFGDQINTALTDHEQEYNATINELTRIVKRRGYNFDSYSDYEKEKVFLAYKATKALKNIMEMPLGTDD